jgi:hypothetical protein
MIFTEIGKRSSAASASRRIQRLISASAKVIEIPQTIYVHIMTSINSNAIAVLYMSCVGAGKMPVAPRIGMTKIRLRRTLRKI